MALQVHGRSISLPSRLNPDGSGSGSLVVEERLKKLEEEASLSSVRARVLALPDPSSLQASLSSVRARVLALADIVVSLNDLLLVQRTQQHSDQDALLECSGLLISACSASRDMVSSLNDHLALLHSALRRRNPAHIAAHLASYVAFRKTSKNHISAILRDLKQTASTSAAFAPHLPLPRVFSAAVDVFRSLLLFLSLPLISSTKWSFISRLMKSSSSTIKDSFLNEIGAVDVAAFSFSLRNGRAADLEGRLRAVDVGSRELETALHHLFRCFLQNRVTLLNILTCTAP